MRNTDSKNDGGKSPNNYKWYMELKKSSPILYHARQHQMIRDAEALGREAFFEDGEATQDSTDTVFND